MWSKSDTRGIKGNSSLLFPVLQYYLYTTKRQSVLYFIVVKEALKITTHSHNGRLRPHEPSLTRLNYVINSIWDDRTAKRPRKSTWIRRHSRFQYQSLVSQYKTPSPSPRLRQIRILRPPKKKTDRDRCAVQILTAIEETQTQNAITDSSFFPAAARSWLPHRRRRRRRVKEEDAGTAKLIDHPGHHLFVSIGFTFARQRCQNQFIRNRSALSGVSNELCIDWIN